MPRKKPHGVKLTEGNTKGQSKPKPKVPPRPEDPPPPGRASRKRQTRTAEDLQPKVPVPPEEVLRRIDEYSKQFYPAFDEAQRRGQALVERHARQCWARITAEGTVTEAKAVPEIAKAISTFQSLLSPPWMCRVPDSPGEYPPELPAGLLTPAEFKARLEANDPEFARALFALRALDAPPAPDIEAGQLLEATPERIREIARHLLGASEADHWLGFPQRIFGGRTATELMGTDAGRLEVYRALLRIEHGVFG